MKYTEGSPSLTDELVPRDAAGLPLDVCLRFARQLCLPRLLAKGPAHLLPFI